MKACFLLVEPQKIQNSKSFEFLRKFKNSKVFEFLQKFENSNFLIFWIYVFLDLCVSF